MISSFLPIALSLSLVIMAILCTALLRAAGARAVEYRLEISSLRAQLNKKDQEISDLNLRLRVSDRQVVALSQSLRLSTRRTLGPQLDLGSPLSAYPELPPAFQAMFVSIENVFRAHPVLVMRFVDEATDGQLNTLRDLLVADMQSRQVSSIPEPAVLNEVLRQARLDTDVVRSVRSLLVPKPAAAPVAPPVVTPEPASRWGHLNEDEANV